MIRHGLFSCHREPGFAWFRIFGIGLYIKNVTRHPLDFCERYYPRKQLRLGRWLIGLLGRHS